MEARLIQGITREEYINLKADDGGPLENQSKAKAAITSAWHYERTHMNPDRPEFKETDAMLRGTLVHELALEDLKRFASFNGTRRGKAWENFKLKCENENLLAVTEESGTINERDLMGCAASAKRALKELGADGDPECAIVFEQHGVKCKMLVDKLTLDGSIFDLKITDRIEKEKFMYHAFDMGWDFQAAWYAAGIKALFDLSHDPEFRFIAVQPTYPYDWEDHKLHGASIDVANSRVEKALNNLRTARETGDWSHEERETNLIDAPLKFYETEA